MSFCDSDLNLEDKSHDLTGWTWKDLDLEWSDLVTV